MKTVRFIVWALAAIAFVSAPLLVLAQPWRPLLATAATSAPATATAIPTLMCNVNLSASDMQYPPDRWAGLLTTDATATADTPLAWRDLVRRTRAAGASTVGTYFQGRHARTGATFAKYPPECIVAGELPPSHYFPPGAYEIQRGLLRIDITQAAAREAFAARIAWSVLQRGADAVMLDGIIHPDSEGSSAPVSMVTGRAPTWADVCDLLGRIKSKIGDVKLFPNVTGGAGYLSPADSAAFAPVVDGCVFEQPFLNTRYLPRTADAAVKIIAQIRELSDHAKIVANIPWDSNAGTVTDAEAAFIAGFALLERRAAADPVYVAYVTSRPVPAWAAWPGELGAPQGDAVRVTREGRAMLARKYAGGSVLLDPERSAVTVTIGAVP